jgi:ATP-dependent DNA helicase RecQ
VLLDALARAGLITLTSETFTNSEGRVLPYKKASLTHEGRSEDASDLAGVVLPGTSGEAQARSPRKRLAKPAASKTSARQASQEAPAALTPAQKQLDGALRDWRKSEAAKTGKPAFLVLSDAVIRNLAIACPRSMPELLTVAGIGPNKAEAHGAAIVAICGGAKATQLFASAPGQGSAAARVRPAVERSSAPESLKNAQVGGGAATAATYNRVRPAPESADAATLTPAQQALDERLREWRKTESEKMGLPQFFVLGTSTLRNIVLERPRTISQLQTIAGVGPEKAQKFGAGILDLCNT